MAAPRCVSGGHAWRVGRDGAATQSHQQVARQLLAQTSLPRAHPLGFTGVFTSRRGLSSCAQGGKRGLSRRSSALPPQGLALPGLLTSQLLCAPSLGSQIPFIHRRTEKSRYSPALRADERTRVFV